jgi:hypothetical protein
MSISHNKPSFTHAAEPFYPKHMAVPGGKEGSPEENQGMVCLPQNNGWMLQRRDYQP